MNDRTYLHCIWREWDHGGMLTCPKTATEAVIWGCLNGHLDEFVICQHHFNLWTDLVADRNEPCHKPDCPEMIDSWERTQTNELTSGFALYMRTRQ